MCFGVWGYRCVLVCGGIGVFWCVCMCVGS